MFLSDHRLCGKKQVSPGSVQNLKITEFDEKANAGQPSEADEGEMQFTWKEV